MVLGSLLVAGALAAEAPAGRPSPRKGERCQLRLERCAVVADATWGLALRRAPSACPEANAYVERAGGRAEGFPLRVQQLVTIEEIDPQRDCARVAAGRADDGPGCRLRLRRCMLFWKAGERGVMMGGWMPCDDAKAYAARKNRKEPASRHRVEQVTLDFRVDASKDCRTDIPDSVPAVPALPAEK